MKKCSRCNRTYSDESFSFCLDDGTLLSAPYDPDATIVLPTTVTSNPASIVNIDEPANVAILKSNGPTMVMTAEAYPPASMSHLVRRVPNEAASNIRRNWTGNDESARNHHNKVPLSESPLRVRLSWKKGPKDSARLVGIFDLDLKQLLKAGYVRYEPKSGRS
jgi:hypothetical protein